MSDPKEWVFGLQYSSDEILAKSVAIYNAVLCESFSIREGNFDRIAAKDLELLYKLYDAHFFGGVIQGLIDDRAAGPIRFRPSARMTRAGGRTTRLTPRNRSDSTASGKPLYEISVAADMLWQCFNGDHRPIIVCGIECKDRLQAMQRIFEHEIVHLIELLLWNTSSCRGRRFHGLANRVFGHKEFTHQLITRAERALTQHGIKVGDKTSFMLDGTRHTGIVNRITKRATVLVEHSGGSPFSDGKRYAVFYVPVHMLEPIRES